MRYLEQGFTLIEMMIVVAIIGILAAIAYPSYTDYIRRGAIPEGLGPLSDGRVKMEQFFMDNRTYANGCQRIYPAVSPNPAGQSVAGKFTITCVVVAATPGPPATQEGYLLTATGSGIINGFTYTIDSTGQKRTTAIPATTWPTASGKAGAASTCWILKPDGSC